MAEEEGARPDRRRTPGQQGGKPQARTGGKPPYRAGGSRAGRPTAGSAQERVANRIRRLPRPPDPIVDEDVTGSELDAPAREQLRTLSKENAAGVAKHLVMVMRLVEADDLDGALAHAEAAVRRAGRVAAPREALGIVTYRRGEWARALAEFRTVRRISGSEHVVPLMVDAERALGRHERALDLAGEVDLAQMSPAEQVELAIVVSGIRRDLGQPEAAAVSLRKPVQRTPASRPWAPRLYYAYAEAWLAQGDEVTARQWFESSADADRDGETDAADRLAELDGIEFLEVFEEVEVCEEVEDEDSAETSASAVLIRDGSVSGDGITDMTGSAEPEGAEPEGAEPEDAEPHSIELDRADAGAGPDPDVHP